MSEDELVHIENEIKEIEEGLLIFNDHRDDYYWTQNYIRFEREERFKNV